MFNIFLRGQLWTIPVFVLIKHGKSLFSSCLKCNLWLMFLGEMCCQLHLLYPSAHEIKIIMFHWPIKPLCFKRKTEKFDCVWYHLCINAQHSSNPCEQMELCRSVTWFCKTAESSMPHLKFLPCLLTGKATDDRHHQVQKPPLNCRQCKSFTWMGKKLEVLLLKHWSLIA